MRMFEMAKRRWFDIRQGYTQYLAFVLSFVNFVLIISVKFTELNLLLLTTVVGGSSGLVSMSLGYFHRHHQLKTDMDSNFEQSRLAAGINLVEVKMMEGTATKEEIAWAKELLERISKT